ncbi:B12-binding domain-containing radical SAM protein [Candidatus Woesearchaeota archaeon]|nr:B12-binding domain-containing radical SAM protein [Candidatus Woesearchaeota archaeon]
MKRVLFFFPNSANWATISTVIPILSGIAKSRGWEGAYFDTYRYDTGMDSSTEKEKAGGFKPGFSLLNDGLLPTERIVPDLQEKIDRFQPDLIVINAMSYEFQFLITFFHKVKIPTKTQIIIGGIHSTLSPMPVAESGLFDLVVIGQGELTFNEILERLEERKGLKEIEGTYFYDREHKKVITNPRRPLGAPEELWRVEQDFSFFDDNYFVRPFDGKMIRRYDMEIARGCPFNCSYCGNTALKNIYTKGGDKPEPLTKFLIQRPFDSSFSHMKMMVEKHKIDIFQITDECFLSHSPKWLEEFMKRYANEVGKPFIFQTRPETVTEDKLEIVRKYNIPFQASLGVESGSEDILKICNRECKTEDIIRGFELLHRYNVRCNAFCMMGLPYETREDYFKTVELCRIIKPSVLSVSIFQPQPGQELTKLCIEKGFLSPDTPMVTFTQESLLNMPPPYLSAKEIKNLWRVFALYVALPKEYYPDIEKCEKDFENKQQLYNDLMKLRWEKYDFAKQRNEKSMLPEC